LSARSRLSGSLLAGASVVLLVFLYSPLVVAAVYAFNSEPRLAWPPTGFSLRWFGRVFADDLFRAALFTSLEAAAFAAVIASIIGTAAALAFTRRRSRLARAVETLGRLPIMLPPLFIGIGLVAFMRLTALSPSLPTIVVGQTIVVVPFVVLVVTSRLRTYELELELAARDLGASPGEVLRRITLPLIAPAILGAALVAFAFSFDEVLITNFTSGTQSTVPIYILGRLRRLVDPGANAVAVLLLLVPWIAFGLGSIVLRRATGSGLAGALARRVE
jgi:ABC-type spermidine/putrescine transport system permease subunit II